MYSSGPDAYRYVFSVSNESQALEFLRAAFLKGDGEFGYRDHIVAVDKGEVVALVGMRSAEPKTTPTTRWLLSKQCFNFTACSMAFGY
jgi:hypothetical protein